MRYWRKVPSAREAISRAVFISGSWGFKDAAIRKSFAPSPHRPTCIRSGPDLCGGPAWRHNPHTVEELREIERSPAQNHPGPLKPRRNSLRYPLVRSTDSAAACRRSAPDRVWPFQGRSLAGPAKDCITLPMRSGRYQRPSARHRSRPAICRVSGNSAQQKKGVGVPGLQDQQFAKRFCRVVIAIQFRFRESEKV